MPKGLLSEIMKLAARCEADVEDPASWQVAAVLATVAASVQLGKMSKLCSRTEEFFQAELLPLRSTLTARS